MRTRTPRIEPLGTEGLTPEQEEYLAPFRKFVNTGVTSTIGHHPRAAIAFKGWATYTMMEKNKLLEREREVVAIRTAWNIKSGYVWSRHMPYGEKAGLSREEMEALKKPISAHDWSAADIALINAADALCTDYFVPDDVWAELTAHFDEEQIIDAIFVCGHFVMLGTFLNATGVQIDPDVIDDPDLHKLEGAA